MDIDTHHQQCSPLPPSTTSSPSSRKSREKRRLGEMSLEEKLAELKRENDLLKSRLAGSDGAGSVIVAGPSIQSSNGSAFTRPTIMNDIQPQPPLLPRWPFGGGGGYHSTPTPTTNNSSSQAEGNHLPHLMAPPPQHHQSIGEFPFALENFLLHQHQQHQQQHHGLMGQNSQGLPHLLPFPLAPAPPQIIQPPPPAVVMGRNHSPESKGGGGGGGSGPKLSKIARSPDSSSDRQDPSAASTNEQHQSLDMGRPSVFVHTSSSSSSSSANPAALVLGGGGFISHPITTTTKAVEELLQPQPQPHHPHQQQSLLGTLLSATRRSPSVPESRTERLSGLSSPTTIVRGVPFQLAQLAHPHQQQPVAIVKAGPSSTSTSKKIKHHQRKSHSTSCSPSERIPFMDQPCAATTTPSSKPIDADPDHSHDHSHVRPYRSPGSPHSSSSSSKCSGTCSDITADTRSRGSSLTGGVLGSGGGSGGGGGRKCGCGDGSSPVTFSSGSEETDGHNLMLGMGMGRGGADEMMLLEQEHGVGGEGSGGGGGGGGSGGSGGDRGSSNGRPDLERVMI